MTFRETATGRRLAFIRDLIEQLKKEVRSIDENEIQSEDGGLVEAYEALDKAANEIDSEITRIEEV
jgi:hypothetical protein